ASGPASPNYTTVRVFYATDRAVTPGPQLQYGPNRSDTSEMTYGTCQVTIPNDHELGQLEAPKWWHFEFHDNPDRHVILQRVEAEESGRFFADLKSRVQNSKEKSAFLFVHGYNTTFAEAAKRTAQITYDLKFEGAPIFYS